MNDLEKKAEIMDLLMGVDDELVSKFFDVDSDELLDEKLEVLKALTNGTPPSNIEMYYTILELYPENEMWD